MDQWEQWRELMERLVQRVTGDHALAIEWGSPNSFGCYEPGRIELNKFGVQYLGPDARLGLVLHEVAHALFSPRFQDLFCAFDQRLDAPFVVWNGLEDQRIERALIDKHPAAREPLAALATEIFDVSDDWAGFLLAERRHASQHIRRAAFTGFRDTFGSELWVWLRRIVCEYVQLADHDLQEMARLTISASRVLCEPDSASDRGTWTDDLFGHCWEYDPNDPCPHAHWFDAQDDLPMRDQRNPRNGKPTRRKR